MKMPRAIEKGTAKVARKSLTALSDVAVGDDLTTENIGAMRPGHGISPMLFWEHLMTSAPRDLKKGEML